MHVKNREMWLRYERYYAVVRATPSGRVVSYGQVAALADLPGRAREVGRALAMLPVGSDVPWYRVVNAAGRIALGASRGLEAQRERLEGEGIAVSEDGRVKLRECRWLPAGVGGA